MLDIEADVDLYYGNYEATYNNCFWHDYTSLFFIDFYNKLSSVEGDYKEVLRLRNLVLNGKRTQYNKDEWKAGNKLLTDKQRKIIGAKKEDSMFIIEEMQQKSIDDKYAEYLRNRNADQ